MTHQWRDLLFAHWRVDPTLIQQRLPPGLRVDTWHGAAYLGVVPFRMAEVRLGPLPAVPGFSRFLELNLRTYVVDSAGVPGVWFHTLDANDAVAVAIARTFFHLPYQRARQQFARRPGGTLTFRSQRRGGAERAASLLRWQPGETLPNPMPGELSHFLVERYVLYVNSPRGLWRGRLVHAPYRLRAAQADLAVDPLFRAQGFLPPAAPPEHLVCCDGTDVSIYGLKLVTS